MDDAELIQRYREGDTEALGALYDRHGPAVYAYLRGMVGPHDADDALQETFLKANDGLHRYEHRGRLRQWLLTLARSRALDGLRKRNRRGEAALPGGEADGGDGARESPSKAEIRRELGGRIREAISGLTPQQRDVFLLREEAELSFREIAEVLEIPLGTALSHMHRAVSALKKELADLEAEV
jgi:RNA polymerase sigma-70 factor (ECF subfamily)